MNSVSVPSRSFACSPMNLNPVRVENTEKPNDLAICAPSSDVTIVLNTLPFFGKIPISFSFESLK